MALNRKVNVVHFNFPTIQTGRKQVVGCKSAFQLRYPNGVNCEQTDPVDFIKLVKDNLHTQDDPQNAVSMFMHSLSISLNPAVVFELLHYFNITNPKNNTFRSHPSDFSFLFPLLSHLRKDSFKQFILFVSCFFLLVFCYQNLR